jgi:hypothetical protein
VNSLNIATLGLLNRGTKPALNIAAIGLLQFDEAVQNGGIAGARPGFGAPDFGRGTNPETVRAALEEFERDATPNDARENSREAIREPTTISRRNNQQGASVKRWH